MKRFIPTLGLGCAFLVTATAHASDLKPTTQMGPAKMILTVAATPLKTGKNTLTLKVTDAKGKPLATQDIKAKLTQSEQEMAAMGMAGMGSGSAKAEVKSTAPGTFEISTRLPFGGKWDLQVSLTKPPASASFSVPVK
ncbi:FixH family protein [Anthocerotibacter panamensis]|uniref:FixH family protein n=1 Tax=Anthocerotibacter panamensis TaxID=2857077 RepID=UPI001C4089CE|nr:FixH family protein [Anthocerotibacter panamensis]